MDSTRTWTNGGDSFAMLVDAPSEARRDVQAMCRHLHADLVADAALVVSELVTNAVQHGQLPVELTVTSGSDDVCVAVRDGSPVQPCFALNRSAAGGFGVRVVDALADTWGVTAEPAGKLVWARLRTS